MTLPFRYLHSLVTTVALMGLSLAYVLLLRYYQLRPTMAAYAHTHETIVSKIRAVMKDVLIGEGSPVYRGCP